MSGSLSDYIFVRRIQQSLLSKIIMNARETFRHSLLLAGALFITAPAHAAEPAESVDTRIVRLEQELADLKSQVQLQSSAATLPEQAKKTGTQSPLSVTLGSGTKVQLYGFARFDASWENSRITPGNIALYVSPKGSNGNDAEWNLTGNATRIGMNLSGPDTANMKLSGNIELDFLTSVNTENNGAPRLRHGYLKAFWPASDISIIAGQTWDVQSALIPFVDDPAILWDAGNIGSRHPQLRLTKGFKTGEKSRIELAIAAARAIGEQKTIGPDKIDTGKDAPMPTIEGRLALNTPIFVHNQPATLAVSGHYGKEEWDLDAKGNNVVVDSWSCNAELSMPLGETLLFAGEYFTGSNLDDFLGGIGQGVNSTTNASAPKSIRAHGGWAAVRYAVCPSTNISLGGGIDEPNSEDLWQNARALNRTFFAAVTKKITPNFIVGMQISDWKTEYLQTENSHAVRAQTSMTYTF